jgi:hypothetical protein
MLSPRQIFDDNIRPADLLLKVFRLLEHDAPNADESVLRTLRDLVKADHDEGLMVIYNEVFLGLIRERAEVSPKLFRKHALCNLLRQAVVIACTGLETYLPAVMNSHFDELIKIKGRAFINIKDKELAGHLATIKFDLPETLRLLVEPDTLLVANRVRAFLETNLSGRRGVHVVGVMFGIDDPWSEIAAKLYRKPTELGKLVDDTISRRNDIVHRADRHKTNMTGEPQEISPAFAMQAVDTIRHVVVCLDELIQEQVKQLRETTSLPQGAP